MKIKEVQAGIKITKNYNSYQASLTAEIETGENPEIIGEELMKKASNIVKTNIDFSAGKSQENIKSGMDKGKEIEVGAAWLNKKFEGRLDVKDSKTGQWKDININDLEKTPVGYKHKTSEGTFIFKKIPKEEKTNNRMPSYRIYKVEDL